MSHSNRLIIPLIIQISREELAKHGKMKYRFELMNILSPERMTDLLKKALAGKGWSLNEGICEKILSEGIKLTCDPAKGELEIDLTSTLKNQIVVPVEMVNTISQKVFQLEKLGNSGIEGILKEASDREIKGMHARAGEALLKEMVRAKQTLNEALKDVYKEAVKEKAASLGTVTSLAESSQNGVYRIKLEIQ